MTELASVRSPLFEAHHAPRYERQALIRNYQETHSCRLVVMVDYLFSHSVTLFEETLYDANPDENLHVMLCTLGGDGETALRLVRQAQSRCKELTVIVPIQAKSAGTLFVLGADRILMGPTSDLGPIDPQFRLQSGAFASGKAIIAAVEDAERRIQANPETYPLHASLLNDITALLVQQAKDAIARTDDQLKEALACAGERDSGPNHRARIATSRTADPEHPEPRDGDIGPPCKGTRVASRRGHGFRGTVAKHLADVGKIRGARCRSHL